MSDKPKRQVEETKDSRPKTPSNRGGCGKRGPRNEDGKTKPQYKPRSETANVKVRKEEGQPHKQDEEIKRDNRPREKN
jgi:hypothetical protein